MAKLVWSEEAYHDLDDITDFILKGSPRYAQIVGEAIILASEQALESPYLGRVVPELKNENLREKIVYSYRLIYRVSEESILVVAILHGARHLMPIIETRL